ncbi:MAG: cob(I)yrinic acid a,c-diamide adenosyltransferase [Chloroflexi bacterium]|nr:cob(I)yrinic acid a,c-diamide adenosyltransferase [Chloroflexota bacterium]
MTFPHKSPRPPEPFKEGLVEVFTGNGKGKTTSALGIVMRAVGHGLRVCIVYFMKGDYPYGEQAVLAKMPNVSFYRFGFLEFCDPNNVKEEEKEQARRALQTARDAMMSGKYDVVVLDEVNVAAAWKLIGVNDVVSLIKDKPEKVELILTGRGADQRVVDLADLVTEMVKVKHPYDRGILSRAGIDC